MSIYFLALGLTIAVVLMILIRGFAYWKAYRDWKSGSAKQSNADAGIEDTHTREARED